MFVLNVLSSKNKGIIIIITVFVFVCFVRLDVCVSDVCMFSFQNL